MPKQCIDCGTVMNDEARHCDSCGASSWKVAPNQQIGPKLLGALSVLLVLALIAFLYWMLVGRNQLK